MITACGVAVLAVAGGVFWISPYNHYHLADAGRLAGRARDMAMSTLPGTVAPFAPAARPARAPEPTHTPLPQRPPVTISPAPSQGDDMAEFLKLGGQTPPPAALVVPQWSSLRRPPSGRTHPRSPLSPLQRRPPRRGRCRPKRRRSFSRRPFPRLRARDPRLVLRQGPPHPSIPRSRRPQILLQKSRLCRPRP